VSPVATGFLLASAGVIFWWTELGCAGFLIVGALVRPRPPRPGKWLVWSTAFCASVVSCQVGVVLLRGCVELRAVPLPVVAMLLALALLLWCDVALVIDFVMRKRRQPAPVQQQRGSFDWTLWISALALTAYNLWLSVPGLRVYRH
jgi:hypothetical protein